MAEISEVEIDNKVKRGEPLTDEEKAIHEKYRTKSPVAAAGASKLEGLLGSFRKLPQKATDYVKNDLSGDVTGAVRGFNQGATMGFGDEILGALNSAVPASLNRPIDEIIDRAIHPKEYMDEKPKDLSYTEARDQQRSLNKKTKAEHPWSYGGGELAGAVSLPVPGTSSLKGAIAVGTGLGALNGLGNSEADLTKGEYGDAAKDSGISGLIGGGGAVAAHALGAIAKGARSFANNKAVKSTGATMADYSKLAPEKQQELGRELLDSKMVTALSSPEDTLLRSQARQAASGALKRDALTALDSKAGSSLDGDKLIRDADASAYEYLGLGHPGKRNLAGQLESEFEAMAKKPPKNFEEADSLKRGYDDLIHNWNAGSDGQITNQGVLKSLRNGLRDSLESEASKVDPGLTEQLKSANRTYGLASKAEELAKKGMDRRSGNNTFGLTSKMMLGSAGGAGLASAAANLVSGEPMAAIGSVGIAALGAVGLEIANRYGPNVAAKTAEGIAKLAETSAGQKLVNQAASKGANALVALAHVAGLQSVASGKESRGTADLSDKYNTQLSPADEQKFQEWAQKVGKTKDLADYDLRGAWKSGVATAPNGHLPDTFKKPNHPTFSDESQYNGADGNVGGKWSQDSDGNDQFEPSPTNIKNLGADGLREYFKKTEPKSRLKLK